MESNTSDARQTPPSFEELVSIIKKLFTDYRDGQPEQPGAVWVKASEPGIKDGHYVAKYKPDDVKFAYDPVGMAFVDGDYIHFVSPSLYDIKWAKGHEELKYLQLLDESAAWREDAVELLRWLNENDWSGVGSGEYINSNNGRILKEEKLYQEFKRREK